ncbi:MAG TPA: FAD-dependent oxidoreductase [Bacilli bacterium]
MYDVAIVGAGPAGASAALFTAKAGKNTIVFDHDKGLTKRAWIENHYGFTGLTGPELIATGIKQAEKFGAKIVGDQVNNIVKKDDGFVVQTEQNGEIAARHVILATGASVELAEKIGVETTEGKEPRIKTVLKTAADGKTNIAGIWAAGTCAGVSVHTIITAGDGAKVAINLLSEMNGQRYVDHDVLQTKAQ